MNSDDDQMEDIMNRGNVNEIERPKDHEFICDLI